MQIMYCPEIEPIIPVPLGNAGYWFTSHRKAGVALGLGGVAVLKAE